MKTVTIEVFDSEAEEKNKAPAAAVSDNDDDDNDDDDKDKSASKRKKKSAAKKRAATNVEERTFEMVIWKFLVFLCVRLFVMWFVLLLNFFIAQCSRIQFDAQAHVR